MNTNSTEGAIIKTIWFLGFIYVLFRIGTAFYVWIKLEMGFINGFEYVLDAILITILCISIGGIIGALVDLKMMIRMNEKKVE